jgi:hypothetical protein
MAIVNALYDVIYHNYRGFCQTGFYVSRSLPILMALLYSRVWSTNEFIAILNGNAFFFPGPGGDPES